VHELTAGRPRRSGLRVLPPLTRPIVRTMPWATLITGCLAGTVFLAIQAHVARTSGWQLRQGNVRLALLPAVAALAFVPRAAFRPLTQTTPVPAWVAPACHLLLAAPIMALTCWTQLRVMAYTIPPHALGHASAAYPLIAQFAGWCAVTVAAAVCVDRSRYADLGGAVAVPVSFGVIGAAWSVPATAGILVDPPATAHGMTAAWYVIASAALAVTCVAMRDQWHRYSRPALSGLALRRPRSAGRPGLG
jgi:hypothetical protein